MIVSNILPLGEGSTFVPWGSLKKNICTVAKSCVDALVNIGFNLGHDLMIYEVCPIQISYFLIAD